MWSSPGLMAMVQCNPLPPSHLQSLLLTEQLLAFWASEGKRAMSGFKPSLHCCTPVQFILAMGPGECAKRSTWWFQSPSKPGRGFFGWAGTCPTITRPSNSHRDLQSHALYGHLLNRPGSLPLCLTRGPGRWPLPMSR